MEIADIYGGSFNDGISLKELNKQLKKDFKQILKDLEKKENSKKIVQKKKNIKKY